MNRPKRNEHNREKILQAGVDLFNKNGYHGTGLKQILDACQVPKGSFYNYFESKEQFAVEVLAYHHQQEDEKWASRIDESEENQLEAMRKAIYLFIKDYETDPETACSLIPTLMGEIGNATDSFREIISYSCEQIIDCIEEDFEKAQKTGCARNDLPPRQLAKMFWDMWQGALLRCKVEASTQPLRDLAETCYILLQPPGRADGK